MPAYLNIQAGYGTIRIFTIASLADGMTGTHQISYTNNFAPTGSAYQVNAFVDKGMAITLGKQNRDSIQQSMTMDYAIGSAAPEATAAASTTAATIGNSGWCFGASAATAGLPLCAGALSVGAAAGAGAGRGARRAACADARPRQDAGRRLPGRQPWHGAPRRRAGRDRDLHPYRFSDRDRLAGAVCQPVYRARRAGADPGDPLRPAGGRLGRPADLAALDRLPQPPEP